MKFGAYLLILIIATACSDTVGEGDLIHLNGYWEIEKVVFQDGDEKEYGMSLTIDYFEYENLKGFRKKVQPKLDGTYSTSNDAEFFEISAVNNRFKIEYSNELTSWAEEIRQLTADKLVLVNSDGLFYHYQRFKPVIDH